MDCSALAPLVGTANIEALKDAISAEGCAAGDTSVGSTGLLGEFAGLGCDESSGAGFAIGGAAGTGLVSGPGIASAAGPPFFAAAVSSWNGVSVAAAVADWLATPDGLASDAAKTVAAGDTIRFVATGPVAVHEASSTAVPATRIQLATAGAGPDFHCGSRRSIGLHPW